MIFRSIRSRLTAWYVVLLATILILFSVLLYLFLSQRLYENIDNSLKASANSVKKIAVFKSSRSAPPGLEKFFEQFLGYEDVNQFYRIYDGSGKIEVRSPGVDSSQFPLTKEAYAKSIDGETSYETFEIEEMGAIRVITMPVLHEGTLANLIQVGTSIEPVRQTLENLKIYLFSSVPAILFVTTFFGRFIAGRSLSPVAKITKTAKDIAGRADFSRRIPVPGVQDEIGQLASTFNDMMDRLERSFSEVRQFSSDASHELRTPLTVLKGQSELLLSKTRSTSEYQEALFSHLEEINYMSSVLEDLFILSKSDEMKNKLNGHPIALGPIIEDVCKHGEILASEKNIRIRVDIKESMLINGDGNKLRQMIWNLIYNAIKYTQPGGEIEISLKGNENLAEITVQDNGIGIPEEDLPLIFNRFYRVDKARSRKEGGSGLGLSICMYIVKLHKGELRVESEFGKGSKFMVSLPKIGDPKLQTA